MLEVLCGFRGGGEGGGADEGYAVGDGECGMQGWWCKVGVKRSLT